MDVFADRAAAAEVLAEKLLDYRGLTPLVLGIPRGGVVMARIIADRLDGEVDVVLVHKLGAPGQPEVAVGAVDEDGRIYPGDYMRRGFVAEDYLQEEVARQVAELRRRRRLYTPGRGKVSLEGRRVIVVDDGLATGSTMLAALKVVREGGCSEVVAATAVAPPETLAAVERVADRVVCLLAPAFFMAVGQFFDDFHQVTDEEVMQALRRKPPEKG